MDARVNYLIARAEQTRYNIYIYIYERERWQSVSSLFFSHGRNIYFVESHAFEETRVF